MVHPYPLIILAAEANKVFGLCIRKGGFNRHKYQLIIDFVESFIRTPYGIPSRYLGDKLLP